MKKQIKIDEEAEARINLAYAREAEKARAKEATKNGKKPDPKKKPVK